MQVVVVEAGKGDLLREVLLASPVQECERGSSYTSYCSTQHYHRCYISDIIAGSFAKNRFPLVDECVFRALTLAGEGDGSIVHGRACVSLQFPR